MFTVKDYYAVELRKQATMFAMCSKKNNNLEIQNRRSGKQGKNKMKTRQKHDKRGKNKV